MGGPLELAIAAASAVFACTMEGIKRHNEDMYNLGKRCWHEHRDDGEAQKAIEHAKFWSDGSLNKAGIQKDGAWTYWLNGYYDARAGK